MEQKNKGSCITFGCEAGGQPNRRQRRGARRRRNKILRGVRHHVWYAGSALGPKDVVLDDERTRVCGERSTTSHAGRAPRPRPTPPPKKDRRTVGPPNLPILLNLSGGAQVPPTSPSGFSWSSSWIAASSGFWHVPARYGRSAAGPWNRTGSNNSCC